MKNICILFSLFLFISASLSILPLFVNAEETEKEAVVEENKEKDAS